MNFKFAPNNITLLKGTMVTWLWTSGYHSTTSDTALWDSSPQNTPYTFSYQFNQTGDYPYYCTIHPFIRGTVVVN